MNFDTSYLKMLKTVLEPVKIKLKMIFLAIKIHQQNDVKNKLEKSQISHQINITTEVI